MNDSTMDDWTRLSAFHDGELDPQATREMQARLDREPALRATLIEIAEISAQLRHLRPAPAPEAKLAPRRLAHRMRRGLALAASLALAGFVTVHLLGDPEAPPRDALAWHAEFASRAQPVSAHAALIAAAQESFGTLPDLTAAGLTLTDMAASSDAGGAYHFAGERGCQLTVLVGTDARLGVPTENVLVRQWHAGGLSYVAVAAGMDAERFASVGAYLETLTRQSGTLGTSVLAMRAATETATRCI
ncbi:anti-sigma factor family protein [Sulfitobacter aestuarii]|uniref:Anti-sigma factor family protein n=1 Tax=Sulfitobacter aestuarii TaxID=2161676 RepID=A0ABW5U3P6_9RHOB